MKRIILILLMASGCASQNISDDSIAGGGCERKTTYGIEFNLLGINLDFALAAQCEDLEDN